MNLELRIAQFIIPARSNLMYQIINAKRELFSFRSVVRYLWQPGAAVNQPASFYKNLQAQDPEPMSPRITNIANAMTVDVEDYFQVSAFDPYISRENWKNFAGRVEANTDRILELFDQHDVRATFFTLGWVAHHYPCLLYTSPSPRDKRQSRMPSSA